MSFLRSVKPGDSLLWPSASAADDAAAVAAMPWLTPSDEGMVAVAKR